MLTDREIWNALRAKGLKPCPSKGGKKKRKRMPTKNRTEWGWKFADGREICDLNTAAGYQEYVARKADMWLRDQGLCCICHTFVPFDECEYEHALGKGMNGGHRDDRIGPNGVAHHDCNSEKGSKRVVKSVE